MKKYLLFILLFLSLLAATNAQGITGPNPVRYSLTDPTGNACDANSPPLVYGTGSTRNIYTCQSGVYAVGTGSGSVPSATATVSGKAVLGAKATTTIAGLGTCAAGNAGQTKLVSDGNKGTRTCTLTTGSTYAWIDDDPSFNITRFGACASCAAAVNATAINAAITAATAAGGGVVSGPSGVYAYNASIELKEGVTLRGTVAPQFSSLSTYPTGFTLQYTGSDWAVKNNTGGAIHNVYLENITFDLRTSSSWTGGIKWNNIGNGGTKNISFILPDAFYSSTRKELLSVEDNSYYNHFETPQTYADSGGDYGYSVKTTANSNSFRGGNCRNCINMWVIDSVNSISIHDFAGDGVQKNVYKISNSSGININGGRAESYPKVPTNVVRLSNVTTVEFASAHNLQVGAHVFIDTPSDAGFDNILATIASVPTSTTFTIANSGVDATANVTSATVTMGQVAEISGSSSGIDIQSPLQVVTAKDVTDTSGGYNHYRFYGTAGWKEVFTGYGTGSWGQAAGDAQTGKFYWKSVQGGASFSFDGLADSYSRWLLGGTEAGRATVKTGGAFNLDARSGNLELQATGGSINSKSSHSFDSGTTATFNGTFIATNTASFRDSAAGLLVYGYSSRDASNSSTSNGELLLGNTASARGLFSYNGANSAKLYIDNTYNGAGTGIVLRTRTSGTPEINATFVDGGTTVPVLRFTNLAFSSTAPTVTSAGTSPSITANNGTAAFLVDVGTGGTASAIVLAMPTATTGWICHATNMTATAANRADQAVRQTASTTTSVTLQNQTVSTGAALAFTASDLVRCQCTAY